MPKLLADGIWSGIGAAIAGAVVGVALGWFADSRNQKRRDRNRQADQRRKLVGSARSVESAFKRAAEALRRASQSGGSLDGWANDSESLPEDMDRLRRHATRDLWDTVEGADANLRELRQQQLEKHAFSQSQAQGLEELAKGFEKRAKAVKAAYDL